MVTAMVRLKSLKISFLIAIMISCFSSASIISLGLAQDSTKCRISGYILDTNGHGIAGAEIIFNVPDIVPSVYSDSSGHYLISAPAGTYHVNVWSPFDSNYIDYDGSGLVVVSDMTKNITLYSGYKVSGYISDTSGKPVVGAVVALNNYCSGWFSNSAGYYFLGVPAGNYTINAHPRTGYNYSGSTTDFPTYYEYNFTVNRDTVKNITVGNRLQTSTPTISPTSTPSQPSPTPSADILPTQKSISTKTPPSQFNSVANNNTTSPPIQQTSSTETEPQDIDVSCWTWIAIAAIVAVPIISFAVLLKNNRKTQNT